MLTCNDPPDPRNHVTPSAQLYSELMTAAKVGGSCGLKKVNNETTFFGTALHGFCMSS